MDRNDVLRTLHRLAHASVSGQAPWPADQATRKAVRRMLIDAKLVTEDPDGISHWPLDVCAEFDLLLYTIGVNNASDYFVLNATAEQCRDMEEMPNEGSAQEYMKYMIFTAYANRYFPSRARQ